mmetsp:Transcript_27437/g.38695  ORF Transcript_27437/g.38695 Transcript_27437/m.38695 type:complete len:430 (-) Transcript_27437:995-2284(-)
MRLTGIRYASAPQASAQGNKKMMIIGSGVGGATLGVAMNKLIKSGKVPNISEIGIYEQAPQLAPVGSAITLAPNALNSLHNLGLYDRIKEVSTPLKVIHIYNTKGEKLAEHNFESIEAIFDYPLVYLERADLHDILMSEIPKDWMHLGRKLSKLDYKPDGVRVSFEDGGTEYADLVVGSDGLRSIVRDSIQEQKKIGSSFTITSQLASGHKQQAASCVMGLSNPVPQVPLEPGHAYWIFGDQTIYGTWVMKNQKHYWVLVDKHIQTDSVLKWKTTVEEDIQKLRTSWHPYDVNPILDATKRAVKVGLYTARPLRTWYHNQAVLLGDAAHPMPPNVGQGANFAIEDATVLAHLLTKGNSIESTLAEYQKLRKPRADRVVKTADTMNAMQLSTGWRMYLRDFVYRKMPFSVLQNMTEWIFKYQPTVDSLER